MSPPLVIPRDHFNCPEWSANYCWLIFNIKPEDSNSSGKVLCYFLLSGHAYHQLPIPSHLRSTVTPFHLRDVAGFLALLALQSHPGASDKSDKQCNTVIRIKSVGLTTAQMIKTKDKKSAWCKESPFFWFHNIACNVSMSNRAIEGKVWVDGMQSLKRSMQQYGKHSVHLLSTYILS